jgi:hypothetical protein
VRKKEHDNDRKTAVHSALQGNDGAVMKKLYFAKHSRSSALITTLVVHAVLLAVAISWVSVSVIIKQDTVFEAKQVQRPRMQLRKLQVPVNVNKAKPRPKLRKQIVVTPRVNRIAPEIKMPEIIGVKGGLGAMGSGGLQGSGLGFSMPEINLFGVKGRGEKIFIIIDSTPGIMYDEMGGIPAYTLIKEEVVRILGELNSTTLINVAVFANTAKVLFPDRMVPATPQNVDRVRQWLDPLNAYKEEMGDKEYGLGTLGAGGEFVNQKSSRIDPLRSDPHSWNAAALTAMKMQADTVFLLTAGWGNHGWVTGKMSRSWNASDQKKWEDAVAMAERKLAEENEARRKQGLAPRVLEGMALINAYCPGTQAPPTPYIEQYEVSDIVKAFNAMRGKHAPERSAATLPRKDKYSVNVIQFVRKDQAGDIDSMNKLQQLAKACNGEFLTLAGLDAIRSVLK